MRKSKSPLAFVLKEAIWCEYCSCECKHKPPQLGKIYIIYIQCLCKEGTSLVSPGQALKSVRSLLKSLFFPSSIKYS